MAEGGIDSACDRDTVDVQIMEFDENDEENFEFNVSTQNRFTDKNANNGFEGGRGTSGWQRVRKTKRKKVSSGSIENIDNINASTFDTLSSNDKLSCLFELAFKNLNLLSDVKNEQTTFHKTFTELKSSVDSLHNKADRTEMVTDNQTKYLKMLAYRSIDTEARSRRNNIIFWGISENSYLHIEELILNFMEDEMSINVHDLVVDRVHRIGSVSSLSNRDKQDPKRPIIARFRDYADTEKIMRNAYKLKGTPFGIDRDYPREIAVARKELYTSKEAKQARENRVRSQIRYPAKLYIDGKLVKDKFPEWHTYINQDRIASFQDIESVNAKCNRIETTRRQQTVQKAHKHKDTELINGDDGVDDDEDSDDSDYSDDSEYSSDDQRGDSVFDRSTEVESHEESDTSARVKKPRHAHPSTNKNSDMSKKALSKSQHNKNREVNKNNIPVSGGSNENPSRKQQQQEKLAKKAIPVVNTNKTNDRQHADDNSTLQIPCATHDISQPTSSGSINRHGENQNRQPPNCADNSTQHV